MTHDWLLVETLGSEPAVVAQGRRTKNLVPISAFLRRNPHLMAIQTAIGETVRAGQGLSSITPKNDRVIRTEVVQMSDGRMHGVHVWIGPPDAEPPERPIPGPLIWDLTRACHRHPGVAGQQRQGPRQVEATHGRASPTICPSAISIPTKPRCCHGGQARAGPDVLQHLGCHRFQGDPIRSASSPRVLQEEQDDGGERLICRAMNWRGEREGRPASTDDLRSGSSTGWPSPVCTGRWSTRRTGRC